MCQSFELQLSRGSITNERHAQCCLGRPVGFWQQPVKEAVSRSQRCCFINKIHLYHSILHVCDAPSHNRLLWGDCSLHDQHTWFLQSWFLQNLQCSGCAVCCRQPCRSNCYRPRLMLRVCTPHPSRLPRGTCRSPAQTTAAGHPTVTAQLPAQRQNQQSQAASRLIPVDAD